MAGALNLIITSILKDILPGKKHQQLVKHSFIEVIHIGMEHPLKFDLWKAKKNSFGLFNS